jgi:hypothetical protein
VATINKQFFKPCGGETEEFMITLQDKALALDVVDETEHVVGIVQRPQDVLLPASVGLMSHFTSFVSSIYIHMSPFTVAAVYNRIFCCGLQYNFLFSGWG